MTGPRHTDSKRRRPPLTTIAYMAAQANTPRNKNSQPTLIRLRYQSMKLKTPAAGAATWARFSEIGPINETRRRMTEITRTTAQQPRMKKVTGGVTSGHL